MAGPAKRRKRNSADDERTHAAARLLQRAWKRHAEERCAVDVVTGDSVGATDRFLLVEPVGGVRYVFGASSLALLFLKSARFSHPVTRRELHEVEVRRLCRRVAAPAAGLLALTWRFQEEARRALTSATSLTAFFHAEAGDALDRALEAACFGDVHEVSYDVEAYKESFRDAAAADPGGAAELLRLHRLIAQRRQTCCDEVCLWIVLDGLDSLEWRCRSAKSAPPPPSTALGAFFSAHAASTTRR